METTARMLKTHLLHTYQCGIIYCLDDIIWIISPNLIIFGRRLIKRSESRESAHYKTVISIDTAAADNGANRWRDIFGNGSCESQVTTRFSRGYDRDRGVNTDRQRDSWYRLSPTGHNNNINYLKVGTHVCLPFLLFLFVCPSTMARPIPEAAHRKRIAILVRRRRCAD